MNTKLSLDEIKRKEINILMYIHDLCEKNGVRYFIAYGTLLGAIRHNGFIPWDDDIDIVVPIEDYDRLISLIKEDKESPFDVLFNDGNREYLYYYAKVVDIQTKLVERKAGQTEGMGVFVDVFPMYGLPDNRIACKVTQGYRKLIFRMWNYCISNDNIEYRFPKQQLRRLVIRIARLYGYKIWMKLLDKFVHSHPVNNKKKCAVLELDSSIMNTEYFEKCNVSFEGEIVIAPREYDKILTLWYGDYMKIPNEEDRISNHDFEVFSI